ncbi:MAG: PAS domain S-box protein [Chloroflexi bacterium]|nr:PAS domain S-box protein [Chloroflexota bacterium]
MTDSDNKFERLRKEAERRLKSQSSSRDSSETQEYLALLHELQTHQLELEIQNEELRSTQSELERSRDEYSDLFDFAPLGFVSLNAKGVIRRANLTLSTMLRIERSDLQNKPLSIYVAPESQDDYFKFRRSLVQGLRQDALIRFRRTDDSEFVGQVLAVSPDGDSTLFLVSIADVTERIEAQAQLQRQNDQLEEKIAARTAELRQALAHAEEANQLKLKFLAMISHELRTPLTSIVGFAETLLAKDVVWQPEEQEDFIENIRDEAIILEDLVGQILDMSALEAGMLKISSSECDVQELLEAASTSVSRLTKEHVLSVEVPEDLPPIVCDLQRTVQVIVNLVHNAAKYSPPGSTIAVVTTMHGKQVQFSIIDQGPGIPLEERPYVFDAFHRSEASQKLPIGGFGLGMAICRGIVEAQGGSIGIDDDYTDGAHVWFRLPTAHPNQRS